MGVVVPCAEGGYKNIQMPLALWLWGYFLLALKSSTSFSSVHAGKAEDAKRMAHCMQELCCLPGTIHPISCWRREEENGHKVVHWEKNFFSWLLSAPGREMQLQLWEQDKAGLNKDWPAGLWEMHSWPIRLKMPGGKWKKNYKLPCKVIKCNS